VAIVRRDTSKDDLRPKKKKVEKTEPVNITLTTDYTEPIDDLGQAIILLTGEKKIGKTSLANQFGKNLVLAHEVGYRGLRIRKIDVPDWDTARAVVKTLRKDRFYTTVTIDTADKSFKQCEAWSNKRLGISHASEEEWGKGWAAIRNEYEGWIDRISHTGKGIILISHTQEKEVKKRNGESYARIMASLPKQGHDIITGLVDIWCYFQYDGDRRILTIIGDDHISAGHRFAERFRTPDGRAIRHIDMGRSPEDGYKNFVKAWNNKYEPERDDDLMPDEDRPKKTGKFKLTR
jgi:hypothetical protein